ncbi:MAG: cobalamin-dependent protein, partial [Candidatus Omnitrophota bacterium]
MRILLINPSTPSFISNKEFNVPLNMLYLGAVLKKAQHNVVLLDLNIYRWRQGIDSPELYDTIMTDAVARHRPQLIGIGCPFSGNILEVLQVACTIKRFTKTVPIVIGGIHPTLFPEEILMHNSCIDWIIIGEGESSLVSLVATIEGGDYAFETIDGFAYRVRGKIVVNPKRSFIANLDEIPFQDYDLINVKEYYHDTSEWHNPRNLSINASLPIITSRSCPMRCSFCSNFKV